MEIILSTGRGRWTISLIKFVTALDISGHLQITIDMFRYPHQGGYLQISINI